MTQITLEAKHCWIDTTPQNLAKNYGDFGIYILGIKNAQGRILPYYVGISKGPLSSRVEQHIRAIFKQNTTYTIFSENFLRNIRGTVSDFIDRSYQPSLNYPSKQYGGDILYLNSESFFLNAVGLKVPPVSKNDRPLDLLDKYPQSLGLHSNALNARRNVFSPGSLFFTPVTLDSLEFRNSMSFRLAIEAFVKYSLKINTIGQSNAFPSLLNFLKTHQISLNIECPEIQKEFHGSPTDKPTILFP